MIDMIEIIVIVMDGFFTLLGAGVVMLVLLNWLQEIRNERRCLVWREDNRGR